MSRREAETDIWSWIGIGIMILGLLLAGAIDVSAEEAKASSLNLGEIQEIGMDTQNLIILVQKDKEYYLNCLKSFQKSGNTHAVEYTKKRLEEIERELAYLHSQKETLSSQKD